jgi:hypothetical protein
MKKVVLSDRQKEELLSFFLCGEFSGKAGKCVVVKSLIKKNILNKDGLTAEGRKIAESLVPIK